jgi:Glycosyltransferase family 87
VIGIRGRPELAAAAAAGLFLAAWGALHVGFYEREQIVDTPVYESYGRAMVDERQVPYRDFDVEYPPLALPVFVVPALGDRDYRSSFETLMAVCGCFLVLFVAYAASSLGIGFGAIAFVALAPLAIGSVILTRFDLWPAMLAAAALAALLAGRLRLGHLTLGLAIAAKLYPGLLLPLTVAYAWRRDGRREALRCLSFALGVVVLAYAPFLVIAPDGTLASIGRQLSRPLQIESLGSAVLLASHQLFRTEVAMHSSHGSQNLDGTSADVVAVALSVAQIAVLLWLWIRFARGPAAPARLARYSAAVIVAFVALGKVLSPQFLIWLAPFVVLAARWVATTLLALALVLTQLWFPFRYWDLVHEFDAFVTWLVVARDLALVALLVVLTRRERESPRTG